MAIPDSALRASLVVYRNCTNESRDSQSKRSFGAIFYSKKPSEGVLRAEGGPLRNVRNQRHGLLLILPLYFRVGKDQAWRADVILLLGTIPPRQVR